jgi:cell division septum initiation protein DivIVA
MKEGPRCSPLLINPDDGDLKQKVNTYMSAYKKERKALKRRIADLEKESASVDDAQKIARCKLELKVLESSYLQKRAARFGIDLVEAVGPWYTDEARRWLNEKEQAKAHQVIADARFDWWKKWIGVISPVASVIIALVAIMLAVLALYLQITGKIPHSPATR